MSGKPRHLYIRIGFLLAFVLFLTEAIASGEDILRVIRKGDTISFLSIKIYGYYNRDIAELVKKANSQIRDLNKIMVGQKVIFPLLSKEGNKQYNLQAEAANVVVTYITGEASFLKAGGKGWRKLKANEILFPGDRIKTNKHAFVELVVNNSDVMRLSSNTELTIVNISLENGQPKAKMKFGIGRIWAKIKSFVTRNGKFEVGFPTAIAGVQGTIYQAELNADSTANIKVYRGKVKVAQKRNNIPLNSGNRIRRPSPVNGPRQVSMKKWVKIVREMQQFSFGPDMPPGDPKSFREQWLGNWEKLNKQRDSLFDEM